MSFTVLVVLVIAVAVGVAVVKMRQDNAAGVIATFGSLRLTPTELIEGYGAGARRHPIAGLSARVEDSGTMNRRITATRMLALGVFALAAPKKQDDRQVYLTIEGPATAIVYTVDMKQHYNAGDGARKFAATVNMHSRRTPPVQAQVYPPALPQALSRSQPPQLALRAAAPAAAGAPGWYPDPRGVTRWFDGYEWTTATRPSPPSLPRSQSNQTAVEPLTHPFNAVRDGRSGP